MRFVTPESVRIDLKDGPNGEKNWIRIKKELSVGDDRRYRAAGMKNLRPGADVSSIEIDWSEMAIARVNAYLVDWSATMPDPKDPDNPKKVKVTPQAIAELDRESFEEIDSAINAYIESATSAKNAKSNGEN